MIPRHFSSHSKDYSDFAPKINSSPLLKKRQVDSIQKSQNPLQNINLSYLLSNLGRLGPNENCYYENGTIYEDGQPRPMTEQEKSKLNNFVGQMDSWSQKVQITASDWLRSLYMGEMFRNNSSVPPWPEMPRMPCLCSNC
uniref:Uncharacterized protein n=1 Tax=Acrobeloides nanus TaxID=290746 RepID=A0A914EMA8_9BILA